MWQSRVFINEYFKAGGSRDLVCYSGYFSRTTKYQNIETITTEELLLGYSHNAMEFYTPEEQELAFELANVLVQEANKRLKLEKR